MVRMNPGLWDWWMQRVSSLLVSVFAIPILTLWFGGYLETDVQWYELLLNPYMKALTVIGLLGFVLHTRLGLWVVVTDYIPRRMQRFFGVVVNGLVLGYLIWGLYLIWVF
ncbi:succinate dehydrogenase, hydrophobic membrane anchor protein [Candidatus Synchoanobacter obligatus]|uniref:Succinate dehydrogenase, hydrophobic membrane anchor protein n=1 Tax=Candidatus Synchoanobacter obligatus TaxID=2919597 RepID=A0ABT1L567_9GAMM|nr:succinate dehydrogenase, hydrophobic membrane anchor protein [Candidatus Synchoanobacter obligatus]MCP8351870.1 succinate dehydrogenase, hydrophobic membrane anchor protein [Candidatus Synchoanobacter obligatus]